MQITLSENLSYCIGVKRTLTLVERLLADNPGKSYCMLGEIVHNEHVINDLKSKGLRIIYDLDEVEDGATVIIQSHGISKGILNKLKERNIDYIDATCPMVGLIHKRISELEKEGYFPVIIGKKGHDEVKGIAGQVGGVLILGSVGEVRPERFSGKQRVGVVVQSTFIRSEALAIIGKIRALGLDVKFVDTICRPTTERQEEIKSITGKFDCILIVGSKTSANTQHLYTLASGTKSSVYLIDEPEVLYNLPIAKNATVFIASGASTPLDLIEHVVTILANLQ